MAREPYGQSGKTSIGKIFGTNGLVVLSVARVPKDPEDAYHSMLRPGVLPIGCPRNK